MEADLKDGDMFLNRFMLVFLQGIGSSWLLKAYLDDGFTFLSRLIGGFNPCYDDILGRFWMLLSDGSWFERQFHNFQLFYVNSLGRYWKLLRAIEADLDNGFTFLRCCIGGLNPCYDGILGRLWMLLREASWFGRHFWIFKPLYCSTFLKMLDDSFIF